MKTTRFLFPPVYLLVGLMLMVLLHRLVPILSIVPPFLKPLGVGLFILGGLIDLGVSATFFRAGTTVVPFKQASTLLQGGLYRYSRNPIYVGMTLMLLGAGVYLGSLTPFLVVPLFVLLIQRLFILPEEQMLEETFGDEYRTYKRRVRRWL